MNVDTMKEQHPPTQYAITYNDMKTLWDHAKEDRFGALLAAYNYGFIRGQRCEKAARRKYTPEFLREWDVEALVKALTSPSVTVEDIRLIRRFAERLTGQDRG